MTVFGIGLSYGLATLAAMFSGMPIAFALGAVAVVFMGIYMPAASLDTVTQNVYEEMASITLLSIPLFILKGAAIGRSRAGPDLYLALHAWLHRIPGGLGVANVFACALFAAANYWQDEAAVFLLVGATFMTAGYVQSQRGHIGIEAFVGLLPPLVNRVRLWLVDVASLLFCGFFTWKSWTLAYEAYSDGQVSNSMWSPPLAIPYGLMACGMTLLCLQILLQLAIPLSGAKAR